LAEGGSISFEELVENDLEFNCISWNIEKNCEEVKPIVAPRITRYANELIEVELEDGEVVRCTPEHLWLLESGEYKQAQYLGSYDALQE
jgi:DNA gyrase subunit B